jgi:hypothetical protein
MRRGLSLLSVLILGWLTGAASLLAQQPVGQEAQVKLAFQRATHLRHGINASMWFAQSPQDYSAARTDRYIDNADIQLIARLGFDHVRLSIDPTPLTRQPVGADGLNAEFLGRIDRAMDQMLASGLAVIVDVHPEEPYKFSLRTGTDGVAHFEAMWAALAAHYATRNPGMIFFEVMNEPEVEDDFRWQGIEAQTIAVIRKSAPQNTILAVGAHWDSLQDLLHLTPFADGNLIYNFHFYEPYEFTHQGAGWATGWWRYTHGVPYPASDRTAADQATMAQVLQEIPATGAGAADRLELERYFLNDWNARHIRLLLDAAAQWGKAHGVPIVCDEFGAFRDHSQPAARAQWIHDVRTALEADGMGWTMWDYRGNFGVVTKAEGQAAVPDPIVVKALGLGAR